MERSEILCNLLPTYNFKCSKKKLNTQFSNAPYVQEVKNSLALRIKCAYLIRVNTALETKFTLRLV